MKRKGNILPINRFLPSERKLNPFEAITEDKGPTAEELLKKIAEDIVIIKKAVMKEEADQPLSNVMPLSNVILVQDTANEKIISQLGGDKIKLGNQEQPGIIIGDQERTFLSATGKGKGIYFIDFAKFPSPHAVTYGPTGCGVSCGSTDPEEVERVRAAADYGLKAIEKLRDPARAQQYKDYLQARVIDDLLGFDFKNTDTDILLMALDAEELFLKRERYMLEVEETLLSRSDNTNRNGRLEHWINTYRESAEKIEGRVNQIKAELKKRGVEGVE
jgi:hypothetical protein